MTRWPLAALCVAALAVGQTRQSKEDMRWPGHYMQALGEPILRARVYLDAGWPHDNVAQDGGAPLTYTFGGGEHVCLQSSVAFCFTANSTAGMATAGCSKAVVVPANNERCFFLGRDSGVIAFEASSGTGIVNVFETRL